MNTQPCFRVFCHQMDRSPTGDCVPDGPPVTIDPGGYAAAIGGPTYRRSHV